MTGGEGPCQVVGGVPSGGCSSAIIELNTNASTPDNYAPTAQAWAVTLLHELGHAYEYLYGQNSTSIQYDGPGSPAGTSQNEHCKRPLSLLSMNHRIQFALIALAACTCCSSVGSAQPAAAGTARLTGRAQLANGTGVAGTIVLLESATGSGRQETETDPQGVFGFSMLQAGTYILRIQAPGAYSVPIKLNLEAGEQRSLPPFRLALAQAGDCFPSSAEPELTPFLNGETSLGALGGNVRSGSMPVVGARVMLACWIERGCSPPGRTATDSEGNFRFENISLGRYLLSVQYAGFYTLNNLRLNVVGGIESSFSFSLVPCPNGDCTIPPERSVPTKPIVCE